MYMQARNWHVNLLFDHDYFITMQVNPLQSYENQGDIHPAGNALNKTESKGRHSYAGGHQTALFP